MGLFRIFVSMNPLITNLLTPPEDAPRRAQREKKRSGQEGMFWKFLYQVKIIYA